MKLFDCQVCRQTLYFENIRCEKCGHRLGYEPLSGSMLALESETEGDSPVFEEAGPGTRRFRLCANADHGVCNWLIPAEDPDTFCLACRHNHLVPDLSKPGNVELWHLMEIAKHRLFYTLLALRLPLRTRAEDPDEGLVFDFLEDAPEGGSVLTGHDNGRITINIAEADDAERERRRAQMHEPYRTLLGHFRHEIGHYYWDRLVRDTPALERFRALFGDERADYGAALQKHYADGAPADWRQSFVSAYATSHPWEDFAETFAHYLHIVDTLETASSFGVRVRPRGIAEADRLAAHVDFDITADHSFRPVVDDWLPLTFALNSLNRSMGLGDLYPFVLTPPVIDKLAYIHDLVHGTLEGSAASRDLAAEDRPRIPQSPPPPSPDFVAS